MPGKKSSAKKVAPKRKVIKMEVKPSVTKKAANEIKGSAAKKDIANSLKPSATPKKQEPEVKKREIKAQEKRVKKDVKKGVSNMMNRPVSSLTVAEVKKLLTMIKKGESDITPRKSAKSA